MMKIGLVGKPNAGKSTFFTAATSATAQIGDYPFTTIDKNVGIAYVRKPCPSKELGLDPNPNNSLSVDGIRFIPIEVIDVAGLVPGAHEGKGMGNKFLDDLRQADVLIQIVDCSGTTDLEGNTVEGADPLDEIKFLEDELHHWIGEIVVRNWSRSARAVEAGEKIENFLSERLAGLKFTREQVILSLRKAKISKPVMHWGSEEGLALAGYLQEIGKPIVIAANKADISSKDNIEKLDKASAIITAADYELALKNATKAGLITYNSGDSGFSLNDEGQLNDGQKKALETIRQFLKTRGSTGVQDCIETAVLEKLDLIAVYPVEDETHFTDSQGRVLPDAYLVPRESTALDLAYKVHTDIGDSFIRAIDCRSKRIIGKDYELQDGDIIKIVAGS
ncbi:MAG TPA: redox-regulated ATPase YchF [Marine Group III euryarchaeote]|uniref:Redox-regulated ATPase YchF n=2 Tax=root TaxID=1 RepID=A0A7J4D1W2_9ARCH|nr:redox-regulated ATPase YchF [Marine Group III euryarchaeote]